MSAHLEPWEQDWLDHRVAWETEMFARPGWLADQQAMDALDEMGPEAFTAWWTR